MTGTVSSGAIPEQWVKEQWILLKFFYLHDFCRCVFYNPNWCCVSVSLCSCLSDCFSWFLLLSLSLWGWSNSGAGFPGRMWSPRAQGYPKPNAQPAVAGPALSREFGLQDVLGPLLISVSPWFCSFKCDIVSSRPKRIHLCTPLWTQDRITLQMLKNFFYIRLLVQIQETVYFRVRKSIIFL